MRIQLGEKVRDVVSGAEGIVVARTEWLNECVRLTFQPPMDKDGKIPDSRCEDELQLQVVEAAIQLPGRYTEAHLAIAKGGPTGGDPVRGQDI